uniref:RNA 2',3'-cyclic phosphodiesterase n=1 Tax=Candidatus Kentrum sp. DK TaxID=2126562 RepID=A0A450ST16_9GAMM|nr:MAG: 2'-5' RNA ligase [Candidatus Kentron sp. DK]
MVNTARPTRHTRRLFFALWPTQAARKALVGLQGRLNPAGRPTPGENLHSTLAFLGSVDTERQVCVERAAGRVIAPPFELRLDRVGCFPRAGIIWSGVSGAPPALHTLVERLNRELAACGFEPDKRPFTAHVTLARKAEEPLKNAPHPPVAWWVDEFCLAESETLSRGARYRIRKRWPLRFP